MTDFFEGTRPGRAVKTGETSFQLPILYSRDDAFLAFHTADRDRITSLMPTDTLHPLRAPGGRALVGIVAFNYFDTTIGPYGEVGVFVPVTYGKRPLLPLLPALFESRYPGFGNVVLHLPVTLQAARDAGRGVWGYPKFVAHMEWKFTPEYQECDLSEGGDHILTLRVAKSGRARRDANPLTTYSVLEGNLIKTVIGQRGISCNRLRPRGCALELGQHRVAKELRDMDLSPEPVATRYFVERSGILPAGTIVERGVRPLEGYAGAEAATQSDAGVAAR